MTSQSTARVLKGEEMTQRPEETVTDGVCPRSGGKGSGLSEGD